MLNQQDRAGGDLKTIALHAESADVAIVTPCGLSGSCGARSATGSSGGSAELVPRLQELNEHMKTAQAHLELAHEQVHDRSPR